MLPEKLPFWRYALQSAVMIACVVPLAAGAAGILLGPGMVSNGALADVSSDSHFRYLSGLLLGIGLSFASTVPHIERKTARFQLLTGIVFVGGLGRLFALATVGVPDHGMLFGLTMELAITPLLAYGQYRLSRAYRSIEVA